MKFKLAISSCPNDTFMFDAIINKRIDVGQHEFELHITDIEKLNELAFKNETDITKISYHSFFKIIDNYQLLNSGSALGKNCGPLIISKRKIFLDELVDCKIAIPGTNTTANLLMKIFYPNAVNKHVYLFSDIETVVLDNECDAGLVIHETRFTYKNRGLKLISDLGNLWENQFHLPIPLGGIAIRRNLPNKVKSDINNILRSSVEFAFSNPEASMQFMKQNAVELDEQIIKQHVELYVNDYSIDLGAEGKRSVEILLSEYNKLENIAIKQTNLFI
ncbi:MAG: 1,4-dihydroxy-6-naphthoate synthase [Bacteroidales bacterium]|nr:1,4-dihydroxy-6-naphthoate synthase [Bacteroidales bacterium]